ncbi:fatty acid oxygenase PpoA [Rhodotorula toruloides]|uniref:linoleate 8R-lipoxygenase n=1 Tax=Rhodotorula toruloides TaxID=5286 RepID=A0A511KIE4_RHOTO|nr:fatty acid oxygenase PpoA [Rhodotorula toruloides]
MATHRPQRPAPTPQQRKQSSSFLSTIKSKVIRSISSETSVMTLVDTVLAAPPSPNGDGLKDSEARALSDAKPTKSLASNVWNEIKSGVFGKDIATLAQIAKSAGEPIDDREMLLENIVTILQKEQEGSPIREPVTHTLLKVLWDDLSHPPISFTGPQYRSIDGYGTSLTDPDLGKAGTPYARTVPPCHPKPPQLPDPSVVFDALLRRKEFKPHPSGISSLLFSFATIIIHSCFQTSRDDPNINETSSYLDLSPLYGINQKEMDGVRTYEQGRLHPDVVASNRLFFMPPSVVALLIVFSRNHNYIVEKLFQINENGKYKAWDQLDEAGRKWQDMDLFEKGRLINCGWFTNVIIYDYVRTILNLNTTESTWNLAPSPDIQNLISGHAPRGTGNAVSAEFNIIYRWHAAISEKDEEWIEGIFNQCLGDVSFDKVTESDFMKALGKLNAKQGADPTKWEIPGIQRTADGSFNDNDLCRILTEATNEVAGAFGANGSPLAMRIIDVLGMATARTEWNVCTMNEFRKFLNLKPFNDFEDWNSDPSVAEAARHLYSHIDNLELFPGLHAEEAKPSREGSGLAPGYTISRAILSDAVALVRGDRFLTTDLCSANLTSWGFQDVQPDTDGGSYGGVIGKLLMRNLPRSYTYNSTYALFPFSTPTTMDAILKKNGVFDDYDKRRPQPPPPVHGTTTYAGAMHVLLKPDTFGVTYDEAIKACSNSFGYFISLDDPEAHRRDRDIQSMALFPYGWQDEMKKFYAEKTVELIEKKSWNYIGKTMMLDIVRDVTNLAAVHWCSHQFGIPLKTTETPHGAFTPQELYLMLSAFFISVFMNFDVSASLKLRKAAAKFAPAVLGIIKMRLSQVSGVPAILDSLARSVQDMLVGQNVQGVVMGKAARQYYERLLENDRPMEQLEASVQSTMTASVSNQGQAAAQVINFFLADENKEYKDELVRLAKLDTPEADTHILSLVSEAMRLDPQVPLIPRVAKVDTTIPDGDREIPVKKGDFVFPSMRKAGMDPSVFPEPEKVKSRDPSIYRLFGYGMHTCLGAPLVNISMVQMIKQIFRLPNVRRAPGKAGQLVRFHQDVAGTPCPVYIDAKQTIWPLPVSLSILYDLE